MDASWEQEPLLGNSSMRIGAWFLLVLVAVVCLLRDTGNEAYNEERVCRP